MFNLGKNLLCLGCLCGGFCAVGSDISTISTNPLKDDTTSIVNFISCVNKFGSDKPEFNEILDKTITDDTQDYRTRVFILYEALSLLTEGCTELETKILLGIKDLISKNYTDTIYESSYEMKLAHILWMSQTKGLMGESLKSRYSGSCLESIFMILKRQKNGNFEMAKNLKTIIEKALKARSIDIGQFE